MRALGGIPPLGVTLLTQISPALFWPFSFLIASSNATIRFFETID
jgi:hypothetical protein